MFPLKKNMESWDQAHYYLSEIHELRPFWEAAVSLLKSSRGPGIKLCSLLTEMCKEHEALIPELSKLYQLEIKEREDSIKATHDKNISDEKQKRKENLTKILRKKGG